MSNVKDKLVKLADHLDSNGHVEEANMLDAVIEHIAQTQTDQMSQKEEVKIVKDRYDLLGATDLLYKRFMREISSPQYKYLGDDIIENAKQKFEQLNNILDAAKTKQSDMIGKELQ